MIKKLSVILFTLMLSAALYAQEYNVENEIVHANRELKRIEKERTKVKKEAAQDKKEYAEYQTRMKEKFDLLSAETDSIKKETVKFQSKSDALGARLAGIAASKREYDIKQKKLKDDLIMFCDKLIKAIRITPPSLSKKSINSIEFLKSELSSSSIDNVEGIYRLIQVLNDIDLQLMDIQVSEMASPIPEITGSVYKIRIGGIFEAFVDIKGEKGYVWSGGTDGEWADVKDATVASKILKTIQVREGKSVPEFIELPFSSNEEGAAK